MACLTEWCGTRNDRVARTVASAAPLPVVLLAATVLLIAASQIQQVIADAYQLPAVILVFVAYVVLAAFIGWFTVKLHALPERWSVMSVS